MSGPTHLTIGIAIGLALAQTMNAPLKETVLITAAAALGSLLPDIDTAESIISNLVPGSRFIPRPGHRTLTHSILFCILLPAVLWYAMSSASIAIPYIYPLALVLGMVSHLTSDMLTPDGVQLLYPIPGFWKVLPRPMLRGTKWLGLETLFWWGALIIIGLVLLRGVSPDVWAKLEWWRAMLFDHGNPMAI